MKKYRVGKYDPNILEVSVIRETERFVVFKSYGGLSEIREMKHSNYGDWFDNWEDAHAFLLAQCELRANQARLDLARANGQLGNVKGMKRPDGTKMTGSKRVVDETDASKQVDK